MPTEQPVKLVKLPPGVSVQVQRETSAASPSGAIEQGMAFTIELPSGTTTTLFVPYRGLGNLDAIREQVIKRVTELQAIEALSTD